jgi:hypothetical protein
VGAVADDAGAGEVAPSFFNALFTTLFFLPAKDLASLVLSRLMDGPEGEATMLTSEDNHRRFNTTRLAGDTDSESARSIKKATNNSSVRVQIMQSIKMLCLQDRVGLPSLTSHSSGLG